jgi:TatD DNase family protein
VIDTHAHLEDEQFANDLEAVLGRAAEAGLEAVICVGTTAQSSRAAVRLAERYDRIYAAVGIHPNAAAAAQPGDWPEIEELAHHPRVMAIGETGLDRYRDYTPFDVQIEFFQRHLQLGRQRNLPVIIHCRDAAADLLPAVRRFAAGAAVRGVLHAFSGDAALVAECLDLGLDISFAGNVSYTNKKFQSLRAAAATVPSGRILVETDAPYLVPEPHRGRQRRNEPAWVVHTVAALAAIRGDGAENLAVQTTANARRLFRLPM